MTTLRFDLLEGLLTPLDQLPEPDQFFAFLTTEDGRAIPVSAHAYNVVILRGMSYGHAPWACLVQVAILATIVLWHYLGGLTEAVLCRPTVTGMQAGSLSQTRAQPYRTPALRLRTHQNMPTKIKPLS